MQRAIVGTAGHIDHGKTSLVFALTGIDCDRWAEEKARGITIDLGFAHLEAGGVQLGFVDVPGHERFLHNALAGLGGIRVMLLVVAADEGVKPQTREHLAICSLLGIPAGLVALTKADLATPDLLELAHLEVDELLAATPYAGAPVLAVSSVTGQGIPELEAALVELAARHAVAAEIELPARLPIDRAFHLRGLGAVVTGTLAGGRVRAGDALELLPPAPGLDGTVRVRSIQVHGQARDEALAGERTSLQLSGAPLEALRRGLQLGAPDAFTASTSLLARVTLLPEAPPLGSGFTAVRLHLHAGETLGRMRQLGGGLVELRLQSPVAAARGDRLVLRRPSPAATLGGGEVLDPRWRRHRGALLPAALAALGGDQAQALAFWALEAGERGLDAADAARRLGLPEERAAAGLAALAAGSRLVAVPEAPGHGRRWIAPAAVERVVERARRILKEYFERDRLADGMPKAEAVRRILRGRAAELAPVYLAWLAAQKVLAVEGDRVVLPGRRAQLSGEESQLAAAVMERFERAGLAPPAPGEVRQELAAKPQILEGVLRHLVARGRLARLPGGLMIAAAALEALRRDLLATSWERFSVAQFKDRFGLTRKWAIPLLEHLDATGVTRRAGDDRLVVRKPVHLQESA
ncbi:MAG TPA: selenocysteine-specific translation elongation factor [Thermoanaerobaculia bacterium]|jgi:selenocysteine-specific elongation factor|nr:selenocysteine-specific translation elongation factor [Thermoanaerobaculia bacterium]